MQNLAKALKQSHWVEIIEDWEYRKNNWCVLRDTSSWWMVGTDANPRVFDVPEPLDHEIQWVINLIEHLCKMEDERMRLRNSLQQVLQVSNETGTTTITKTALTECYHTWLVGNNKTYCPVCQAKK